MKKKCNICHLINIANKFENHLASDRRILNRTKGLKKKVGCETCNKNIKKVLYENLLGIQFHINKLDERTMQKRMPETFNVDIRWEIFKWDKRTKMDKLLFYFVKMIKWESKMSYYFESEETRTL